MRPNQTLNFLHRKGNHQRTKKQPTGWEKIFANELKDM